MATIAASEDLAVDLVRTARRLVKSGVAVPTDSAAEAIDRIVEYSFWQLMLADDLEAASRDIDLLCACLRLRMAQILVEVPDA